MTKWDIELSEYDISYHPRSAIKGQALAEFVNKVTFAEGNEGNWLLYVDGSSTLTGSGVGVVLTSLEVDELEYALHFDFKASTMRLSMKPLLQVSGWH
ncbi:UNVERIFIED_CONTAM: hypothetical protein Sangu_2747900 [Sesamum angustifolium]|uniref:Gag-pol polyprotein n=1 Tax=Sesamum angustifolium TaxID=2727405 RepID=A0AAW2IXH6_9LAMI